MAAPQPDAKPLAVSSKLGNDLASRTNRMPKFVRIGLWLLRDAFGHAPWSLAFLVLLGFVGAALQASVLLTLHWATSELATSDAVRIPGLAITLDTRTAYYAVAAAIILQATTAAICVYVYRVRTIHDWGRYQLFLGQRLLREIAHATGAGRIEASSLRDNPVVSQVLSRSIRRVGMLFRRMVYALALVVRLLTFLMLSLYVHAGVTLILLAGTGAVAAASVLKFARDSSHKSRAMREGQRQAQQQWRNLADRAVEGETVSVDRESVRGQPIGDFLTTFQARFINLERSRLMALVAMVVLTALTMGVYGNAVLEGRAAWQDMTTAIIAVVLTMLPMSQLASVTSIFGHYYPDVKLYRDLLDVLTHARNNRQASKKLAMIAKGQGSSGGDQDPDDDDI